MQSVVLRAQLESALGERISKPFIDIEKRVFESASTGIAPLDALTGGLPRGAITEIFGAPSSGRTSLMLSILAETTARDEVCALIDGNDAFDPKSGAAAGVRLQQLLWVRCHKLNEALKATDLLLQGGGFGCVAMDLGDLPLPQVQSIPLAAWFRLQRVIENTPAMLVVLSRESVVKSAAALVLRAEIEHADWSALLEAVQTDLHVVRVRTSNPKSKIQNPKFPAHVRLYFRSPFSSL